jgi:VIT1/CCC1 family predicted Fe2+/Mn2+ transporter
LDVEEPSSVIEHKGEAHHGNSSRLLNRLRAGVLGANDGIVSTASLVLGVTGAGASTAATLTAGTAGLVAGAMSMAAGEYVSVSSQRDAERASLELERWELANNPTEELAELTTIWQDKGLPEQLAHEVAVRLTQHDALAAHAEAELHLDPENLTSAWSAAAASACAFTVGSLLPLASIALAPRSAQVSLTAAVVVLALALTGLVSARVGGGKPVRAVVRTAGGGSLAMGITYAVGWAFGTAV